jgi:hypothetical protein
LLHVNCLCARFKPRPPTQPLPKHGRYTTRIEADAKAYPVLLSNGNLIDQGKAEGARHYAVWEVSAGREGGGCVCVWTRPGFKGALPHQLVICKLARPPQACPALASSASPPHPAPLPTPQDPYPKPCYLFALVAGDLQVKEDSFTTASGRKVALRIYTQPQYIDQVRGRAVRGAVQGQSGQARALAAPPYSPHGFSPGGFDLGRRSWGVPGVPPSPNRTRPPARSLLPPPHPTPPPRSTLPWCPS